MGGLASNDKFFSLPEEKKHAIINAGYRVFSQNTYKKAHAQYSSRSRNKQIPIVSLVSA